MRKLPLLLGAVVVTLATITAWLAYAARVSLPAPTGGGVAFREAVTALSLHPAAPGVIWAGTRGGLFGSEDGGRRWRRLVSVRGAEIHEVAAAPSQPTTLYLATSRGLYRSTDAGRHWQRRYRGADEFASIVWTVAIHPTDPQALVIGTAQGVQLSRDGGATWAAGQGEGAAATVSAIVYHPLDPTFLYMVSAGGLYRSADGGLSWTRLLVQSAPDSEEVPAEEAELSEADEAAAPGPIGSVAIPAGPPVRLIVGTDRGLWSSTDAGHTWQPLPTVGLGRPEIRHLLVIPDDPDQLYAATSAGVFVLSYTWQAWQPMVEGIPTRDVRRLAWSAEPRRLWVATDLGLLQVPWPSPLLAPASQMARLAPPTLAVAESEPSITEVQAAAIRYAEVSPEKIASWRTGAAWRAWLPRFTLGIDRDRDTTIGSSSSGGKTTFTVGPEDESFGVGFDFTWDLADLIWSSDQTSIDVRSRLMVQLRNDVLDEATRLYFERRRLQVEYAANPVSAPALRAERQLRLDELAAQLDALTGGYFTEQLRKNSHDP